MQGILTLIIAAIAVYIAWQQWKTNAMRLRLDTYDRRLRVYQEIKKILSLALRDGALKLEDLQQFISGAAEADFLFGPEIPEYVNEIYKRGLDLWSAHERRRVPREERPDNYDPKKLADEKNAALTWLTGELPHAKEKFKKYLDMSK